jgi:hypothetical protein
VDLDLGNLLWIFVGACVVNNFTLAYFLAGASTRRCAWAWRTSSC